jgi:hypothetical protein
VGEEYREVVTRFQVLGFSFQDDGFLTPNTWNLTPKHMSKPIIFTDNIEITYNLGKQNEFKANKGSYPFFS